MTMAQQNSSERRQRSVPVAVDRRLPKTPENIRALADRLIVWEREYPSYGDRKVIVSKVMEFTGKSRDVAYAWMREARFLISS